MHWVIFDGSRYGIFEVSTWDYEGEALGSE